jgi:hypothetical protein
MIFASALALESGARPLSSPGRQFGARPRGSVPQAKGGQRALAKAPETRAGNGAVRDGTFC